MKQFISLIAVFGILVACSTQERNVDENNAPSVTVGTKQLSAVSVVLMGKANLGSSASTDLKVGFQYSKYPGILPSNCTTVDATDADANYNYTSVLIGLEPETTYYYRSFIHQNGQDTHGETMSFTTKGISSILETQEATDIKGSSAQLNAKLDLTDVQYKSVEYGFRWVFDESDWDYDIACNEIKNNTISIVVANLSPESQYKYKAYLKLDRQTFCGEVKTFTTGVLPVESISLNKTEYIFGSIGNSFYLIAIVLPYNATNNSLEWSSDNEDVAIVDQHGKVTAVSSGTALIKAMAQDGSGVFASCVVRVLPVGAVDLGLSVYWATCNLSESGFASSPEAYGDYYAWGETETYYSRQDPLTWKDGKTGYDWMSYSFCNGSSSTLTKYNTRSAYGAIDNKTVLEDADDVVRVKLGNSWRMPTDAEWTELRTKCTCLWTSQNGICGQLVTGPNGNSIFLPAAGYWYEMALNEVGSFGCYWSSSLYVSYPDNVFAVYFGSSGIIRADNIAFNRCFGLSVRPVTE